jgi:hypothetical protein
MDPAQAIVDFIYADDVEEAQEIERNLLAWYRSGGFRPTEVDVLDILPEQRDEVFIRDTIKRLVELT